MGKRGQVWVETVIYTLIGLTIIGLVLAAALPKIEEKKDAIAIEQSIDVVRVIDKMIYDVVNKGIGNRRVVDLEIRKGSMVIDMEKNEISWILDSSFAYSEIGLPVSLGGLYVTTSEANPFEIELKLEYDGDIRFNNETTGTKIITIAPTPYKFIIENIGVSEEGNTIINLLAN